MERKSRLAGLSMLVVLFIGASITGWGCSRNGGPSNGTDRMTQVDYKRNDWVRSALGLVSETLRVNPPGTGDPERRKEALFLLDDPLHLACAPEMEAVGDFFRRAVDRALSEIETESVTSGATVWKLYNHGFVVKTNAAVFAFDIFRGVDRVTMDLAQVEKLARAVDVMFISHYHDDHADYRVAELLLAKKKKVVVIDDLWTSQPISGELIRNWDDGEKELEGLKYRIFKGHQGEDIPNNVYFVSSGGISVMHTGDQSNADDFGRWIDGFGGRHRVDVLLPNCWTTDMERLVREIDPRLVITGHENELGHTVDHRESFAKTFGLLAKIEKTCVVMNWGERYHLATDGSALAR